MTETVATLPTDLTRTAYSNEAVWLPRFGLDHINAGQQIITGKTFTDCLIEGPAVMMVFNGVVFDGCNMGVASDPTSLLLRPVGSKITGVIGFADCRFDRCRFVLVGFTGLPDFIEGLKTQLISAREAENAAAGKA